MAALRKRLEEQEYNSMVSTVRPTPKSPLFSDEEFTSHDEKVSKNQLSAIVNVLFSMISVFVAIFIWMRNSPDHLVVWYWSYVDCREYYGAYSLQGLWA